MPIPLHGFLQGDTLGLVIFAEEDETVLSLGRKIQRAASVRVRMDPGARVQIVYRGAVLDPAATVSAAGITALDRVDVRIEGA